MKSGQNGASYEGVCDVRIPYRSPKLSSPRPTPQPVGPKSENGVLKTEDERNECIRMSQIWGIVVFLKPLKGVLVSSKATHPFRSRAFARRNPAHMTFSILDLGKACHTVGWFPGEFESHFGLPHV